VGPTHCKLYVTGPLEGLALRIKIATYGGLFMASPVILWEVWRFITPGLNRKEKRYAVPFIVASITLFAAGAVLAYYTFPHALGFLEKIGGPSLQQIYSPSNYIGLIVALMAVFGITFEFPVVLVSLELAGVLKPAKLASWRRWAIVVLVAVAAIITPSGDPFSMMALAVPLYLFYELSILIGKVLLRRRTPAA
jgi:sec-independent protein translocase protein TatC